MYMLLTTEQYIIKNGYYEFSNEEQMICYIKKDAPIDQIIIKNNNNSYELSYPMKNSSFNYKTSFNNVIELNNYIKNYI